MCLAVPLKIKRISKETHEALVERDGVSRTVQVNLIDDPQVGDYVVVHAGFAIEKVEEAQALDDIATWEEFEKAMREASAEIEERARAKTVPSPAPA